MEFDFQRIDQLPLVEVERTAGPVALVVQRHLASVEAPTFVLGRKAFRLAVDRLPPGHRPLDLVGQELDLGRELRRARAYERMRASIDLLPSLALGTPRCLVWSSPVLRPRKRTFPGLVALVDAPSDRVVEAVTELWAAVFLEPVLERVPSRVRRLELAVGVTEDTPQARALLLEALEKGASDVERTLPPPAQGAWPSPPLAFDRSLERLRAQARRPALKRAFGAPILTLPLGRSGPGLDREQVDLLVGRQSGGIGAAVARDLVGPVDTEPRSAAATDRPLDWARLGAQVALHVAQMTELGREVERIAARAERRHDWLVEMDLQLLPDDGLRTTLEEQLTLVPAVTDLALRAALASARLSRTYAALTGADVHELDLGVRFPLTDLLVDFHTAGEELLANRTVSGAAGSDAAGSGTTGSDAAGSDATVLEAAVEYVAERHLHVFPRQGQAERAELARAFVWLARAGAAGASVERRIEMARVRGDEVAAEFESRLPRLVAPRLSPLRSLVVGASQLRERARQLEVLADAMLRAVALEVDRRLPRLEPGLPEGSVWHCHVQEILATVDLRGTSLEARVRSRSQGETGYYAATDVRQPRPLAFAGERRAVPLARARALDRAVWLLLDPWSVDYRGRDLDTLPSLARALGLRWPPPERAAP